MGLSSPMLPISWNSPTIFERSPSWMWKFTGRSASCCSELARRLEIPPECITQLPDTVIDIVASDRCCVMRLTYADKAAVIRAKGKSSLALDVVSDLLIADVPRTGWSWIKSQLAIWQPAAVHLHKNGHWILLFWLNSGGTSGSSRDITHRHNNDTCKDFAVDSN